MNSCRDAWLGTKIYLNLLNSKDNYTSSSSLRYIMKGS
ncbi:hypothetical protein VPHD260_0094 [Vibrio phage D260]